MPLETAVFVDGYNLYYGRIRSTPFKWLDLIGFFKTLLNDQDPETNLGIVSYFTSPALGRFATHGEASVVAQSSYIRALQTLYPKQFSVTYGKHSMDKSGALLPRYEEGKPYDRTDRLRVWKLEEKQTDVNLALAMYREAASGKYQQLVVCSNDSDVEPVLKAIKEDFPEIRLGVVTPRWPSVDGKSSGRAFSSSLANQADWTRHYLLDQELLAAQMPNLVQTGKKPIRKPAHW